MQVTRITNVISETDMLHFVHVHAPLSSPPFSSTLKHLGLELSAVVSVPASMAAYRALQTMVATQTTSLGIVDPYQEGELYGLLV